MKTFNAVWKVLILLMVTGANVAEKAIGAGPIEVITETQAEQEEPPARGSSYRMTIWRERWMNDIVFVDGDGNKIKGSDIGMDEFRELLEKALPSFPRRLRRILREWLMVHRLGFGSRRAKKVFKMFFGWPPGLSFMQGATTHHWSAIWAIPASIFRLIRTASGTWRRIFLFEVPRAHNDEDGIPLAARQHISHFTPLSLYAPTPVGKTVGMQWGNSLLVNAEMNLLIGQYGQPTQWVMMPLCVRFRIARACVSDMRVPNKVRTVLSDWLGITPEGVAAMAYSNFDYRNFLK